MQHVLFFPVDERRAVLLYRFNSDRHTAVQALLEEHTQGRYVQFDIDIDGEYGGKLAFLAGGGDRNTRAEQALAFVTDGTHMEITGPACLVNLAPELVEYVGKGDFR